MTAWVLSQYGKSNFGHPAEFGREDMIPRFTCLFHEAKRDYVSLHKQYSWVEKDGVGTKESDLKRIRLASYFASLEGKDFVGRRARDRFNSRLLPCRFALQPRQDSHTHASYIHATVILVAWRALYWQSVTQGGTGCATILSSDRFGFLSRKHRWGNKYLIFLARRAKSLRTTSVTFENTENVKRRIFSTSDC